MPINLKPTPREFQYETVRLPDPNPDFTVEQVRAFYATTYPDITTATLSGPEARNGKMMFTFGRAIGSKG